MKLKHLSLANFRGFEQIDIDFESDLNVISGENGLGKSSILCSIATILSRAMNFLSAGGMQKRSFEDTDIRDGAESLFASLIVNVNNSNLDFTIRRSSNEEARIEKLNQLIKPLRELLGDVEGPTKEVRGSSRSRIQRDIKELERSLNEKGDVFGKFLKESDVHSKDKDVGSLVGLSFGRDSSPLAVYYSTKRFFNEEYRNFPKIEPYSMRKAYSNALEDLDVSLRDFAHWFSFACRNERGQRLTQTMAEVASEFIPEFRNLRITDGKPPRFLVEKNGTTLALNQLSDGERGLLAMIFDLTRRLSIVNPTQVDPISEGEAIVLIDEIELHLHPKWQREVVGRLKSTFKNCQFILTTHSPVVLGETEARCVRFLRRDKEQGKITCWVPEQSFGLDVNRILNDYMRVPERSKKVTPELDRLFELIDEEKFDEARSTVESIRLALRGDDPEIVRAESLIKFMEGTE